MDDDIGKFLAYVDGKAAKGEFTQGIAVEVERVKQQKETKVEYMELVMELKEQRREGYREGRTDGLEEALTKMGSLALGIAENTKNEGIVEGRNPFNGTYSISSD